MTYEAPYRVECIVRPSPNGYTPNTYYALIRTGEGELVHGGDAVLMHRICELLNDQENGKDVHR